jgi:type IV pilus assembly protein PilC
MLYYYAARSAEGAFLRGSLQAASAQEALAVLGTRGLFVSFLDEGASLGGAVSNILQARRLSQSSVVAFFRSLATLISAGVSLSRSLAICVQQTGDSRLREALRGIAAELQNGRSLSEALLTRPREFSHFSAASIRAGEQTGTLDEILMRLATGLERDRVLRKKLASALTYPAIVLAAAIGVSVLLLTTTVPIFQSMYVQLRVEVPPALRLLVFAGAFLRSGSFIAAAAGMAGVIVLLTIGLGESQRTGAFFEAVQLGLPVIGATAKKAGAARVARLLGMLLNCGVSIHAAIPIVSQATQGPRFRASVEALRRSLFEGSSITPPLEASGLYDSFFVQLVRVGEETGTVGEMLQKIAEYYELEVETALQQLGTALEPVLIVLLGGVVGTIAAAIFIPLYSLIGSIK